MIWRLVLVFCTLLPAVGRPAARSAALDPRGRELLAASLHYAETYWDEAAGLLWSPVPEERGRFHRTRESAWYALGLLQRAQAGDEARACRIIEQVLALQLDAPGLPWDGTFRRAPEEAAPGKGAELWKDFDPNWRQFIGTTFALMLAEFEPRLPAALAERMVSSIRRAVVGELVEGRAESYHTNVALMQSFLWGWAGARLHRSDWVEQSEAWAVTIQARFAEHETLDEYNSPTYYGVDLYGLALWRQWGATGKFRQLGRGMEAALWRDIARFYHAGLRNLCGPFDRAYGLDQRRYVSLVGVWMGLALEAGQAPMPDPNGPMDHAHDFLFAPNFVVLGTQIPPEVMPALRAFQHERALNRVITPERTATAWISSGLMLGGEITAKTRGAGPRTDFPQFRPATAHWRIGVDDVGAFALVACPPVDARAEPKRLSIATVRGDATFRIEAPGSTAAGITREHWSLPNLEVSIDTDASDCDVEAGAGFIDVTYRAATRLDLIVQQRP